MTGTSGTADIITVITAPVIIPADRICIAQTGIIITGNTIMTGTPPREEAMTTGRRAGIQNRKGNRKEEFLEKLTDKTNVL